ncbi:hypothetical protein O1M63_09435 [Streptomyces mirabilis]|nr:hypothetical protein [Streptomyces mirabilis]
MDSYHVTPDREAEPWLLAMPARIPAAVGERFDSAVDDLTLLALGAYTRMFRGWDPQPTRVPTLLVRACEPLPDMPARWRSSWPLPHDTVDAPGSHLGVLGERPDDGPGRARVDRRARSGPWKDRMSAAAGFVARRGVPERARDLASTPPEVRRTKR